MEFIGIILLVFATVFLFGISKGIKKDKKARKIRRDWYKQLDHSR